MYKSIIGAIIFLLMFFTIGCKDDPIVDDVNINIEDEFKVIPWETLDGDSRTFHLNVETIKSESCENTTIDVAPSTVGSDISFTIHAVPEPDCPAPIFVANANVEIGLLNFQSYDLIISLKNVIQNKGTLDVTGDYYDLKMTDLNGIVLPEKRLYKVPQNSIWGYIAYDDNGSSTVADNFVSEVSDLSDGLEYIDGFYGYFSSLNNELTILNKNFSQNSIRTFGFAFDGDSADLESILETYRTQNLGVEFKIYTSLGEEF